MKLGIGNKIILIIETTVVVVIVFAGVTTYMLMNRAFEKQVFSHLESVSSLKENNIKEYLGDMRGEIESVVKNETTRQALNEYLTNRNTENKKIVSGKINDLLVMENVFSDVLVLDKNGVVVFSTNEMDEEKIKSTEQYFLNAKENTFIQDYFYDVGALQPSMMIATPIKDEEGNFLGILAGKIYLERISNLMSNRSGVGRTGETFMVNSFNLVVTDLLKEPGAAMRKTIYLPQIVTCLSGQSKTQKVTDYHGDAVLEYYRWFPEMRSCLVTKVDYDEAMSPVDAVFWVLLGVLLGGGLLMGFLGYFQAKLITGPIKRLHKDMLRIKSGDLDVRSEIKTGDEIGEMAEAFNEMAAELKSSYTDMENKIEEKTRNLNEKLAELEKTNRLMVGRELKMIELKKKLKEKNEKV